MDQKTFLEVTAMLNAFPQGSSDPDVLTASIERATDHMPAIAVVEAAQRFTDGLVAAQSKTFAPSVAEFVTEARRITELLPYRGMKSIMAPKPYFQKEPSAGERTRMKFKMAVLSAAVGITGGPDALAKANNDGLEAMVALGQRWGVPVPDELFEQLRGAA